MESRRKRVLRSKAIAVITLTTGIVLWQECDKQSLMGYFCGSLEDKNVERNVDCGGSAPEDSGGNKDYIRN